MQARLRAVAVSAFCLASAVALSACNLTGVDDGRPPDLIDKIRQIDLTPRQLGRGDDSTARTQAPRAMVVEGQVGGPAGNEPLPPMSPGSEGFELNFENTPVSTVAKVILGDILGLGYTIDPRVQGTISLASGRPVPKSDMLYALETALRINNVVMSCSSATPPGIVSFRPAKPSAEATWIVARPGSRRSRATGLPWFRCAMSRRRR